ncbi:MAG: hypothetical protein KF780_11975 [Sphingomonas sp.]|nr:hypothetical protein [Sphingomonas sp.]
MVKIKRSLSIAGICAALCGAGAAWAQESDGNTIGPPQLRDFSLEPNNRIVAPPAPEAQPQSQQPQTPPLVRIAPPLPAAQSSDVVPPEQSSRPVPAQPRPTTSETLRPAPAAPIQAELAPSPFDASSPDAMLPQASPPMQAPDENEAGATEDAPVVEESGAFPWLYVLPALLLALLGAALLRRRLAGQEERPEAEDGATSPAAAAPASSKPRPEPGMRPWLELEIRTERAAFTDAEASVNFELEIRNSGKSPAKNLRIDVKMFNGSEQQDKEIGAFFRTAGRETTRLNLPTIAPGQSGVIRGEVGMPRDQMRALRLDDRMLFIPVIAVNALYDCDDGRTGQTSRSYIVGRELQAESERMGAFRVDQGPRIWRTVGQRPHKLARRV